MVQKSAKLMSDVLKPQRFKRETSLRLRQGRNPTVIVEFSLDLISFTEFSMSGAPVIRGETDKCFIRGECLASNPDFAAISFHPQAIEYFKDMGCKLAIQSVITLSKTKAQTPTVIAPASRTRALNRYDLPAFPVVTEFPKVAIVSTRRLRVVRPYGRSLTRRDVKLAAVTGKPIRLEDRRSRKNFMSYGVYTG